MEALKKEAINVIFKMPDTAEIDDIMYRLYVIDKVRKGGEAVGQGDCQGLWLHQMPNEVAKIGFIGDNICIFCGQHGRKRKIC